MSDDVFKLIEKEKVEMVDLRFTDIFGQWQHFTVPTVEFLPEFFTEGIGFDGSSIRGFKAIQESDLLLKPDPSTVFIDPFFEMKTLCIICDVYEPGSMEPFAADPRFIARKAQSYLEKTGIADKAYFGPEAEFFIFDSLHFGEEARQSHYAIDSTEGFWNSSEHGQGYTIRAKQGYFPVPPHDTMQDIRSEISKNLANVGIIVERHHHEVATAGQAEIDIKYGELLSQADNMFKFKYIIKATAKKHGKVATFMPKPLFGDNGSGMHTHMSLWKEGKPLFAGDKYGGLSEMALYFIGGLLAHAPAILAFAAPTTNSYKRLVPGYEAPVNLVYSARNRSAAIRIPMYSTSPNSRRVEFRPPDAAANPYLAFSAMLLAGLDGIEKKIDPGAATDKNLFSLSKEELANIKSVPGTLGASLMALKADSEFLTRNGVFAQEFIDQWISMKIESEIDPVRLRPHPHEFTLYHDC